MARIVMPLADGFEDSEYTRPRKVLEDAGHQVTVLGLEKGETLEGKRGESKAQVDASPAEVDPGDFDLLLIAGGHSPDQLRTDQGIVDFVRRFGVQHRRCLPCDRGVFRPGDFCRGPRSRCDTRRFGGRSPRGHALAGGGVCLAGPGRCIAPARRAWGRRDRCDRIVDRAPTGATGTHS
jgi:hypothetical protein